MAIDNSLIISKLAALLLESIVYGIFLVLFCILLLIAFSSNSAHLPKKRYIIPIGSLMLLLATAHLVIDFLRAFIAFVPNNQHQTPDRFFKKLSHPYAILNWALYGLQTILGDSILVWRCYVFWDRRWWTIIPGALLIAYNIADLIILSRYLTLAVGSAFIHLTRPWMVSWIASTTALQLLYSLAIVFQITKKFNGAGRHVNSVLKAIIESCAIYTLFALALLIAFERASDADWVLLDMITPLVGISYCLIIIQLHVHFRTGRATAVSISNWAVENNSTTVGTATDSFPMMKRHETKNHSSSITSTSNLQSNV